MEVDGDGEGGGIADAGGVEEKVGGGERGGRGEGEVDERSLREVLGRNLGGLGG